MNKQEKNISLESESQLSQHPTWIRPQLIRLSADMTQGGTVNGTTEAMVIHLPGTASAMLTGSL